MDYQYLPNVLVGINYVTAHITGVDNIDLQSQLKFSPEWPHRPYSLDSNQAYSPSDYMRSQTNVSIESNKECASELRTSYSSKSMMSLDGIFSPISFYPTPYSRTFNISKYSTPNCPFCFGTKTYAYTEQNDSMQLNFDGFNKITDAEINLTNLCPFCEETGIKKQRQYLGVSPREVIPPFIIASGDDLTIISQLPTTGQSGTAVINYATLNPIVLSSGEFSNFQNKQSGDLTGHSIDLVAFGFAIPKVGDGLRPTFSKNIDRSYSPEDINLADWSAYINTKGISAPSMPTIENNMRFFGLRGPIMLHGWGYDLEGFPVPNSSGEPLIQGGSIVRDKNNNIVGKNQKSKTGGGWTEPYKENTFYKGWAQQPGSWPVGPIDFRWDDVGKVWTVGSNYKPVYVIIEEDLVGTRPSRGELVDSSYDNSPLPDDLRRLVFVKDSLGMFAAPRGAALYCRYDSNNGFYQPIAHKPFFTSGTIISSNTANIYKIYSKPNNPDIRLSDDPNLEIYETIYKNPLNYNPTLNSTALFTFLDGYWTLCSYNSE